MKHICYITGLYSRSDSLIFIRQSRSIVKENYRATIVTCDILPDEVIDGVNLCSCGWQPKGRFDRMMNSQKHLYKKAIEIDADIYQISEPELISLGIKLKKRGKKVIFNMRENYIAIAQQKEYIPRPLRVLVSKFVEYKLKTQLPKYDAVFSVTDSMDNDIKKWGVKKSAIVTNFPNISNNHNFSLEEYKNRENTLCYFGTVYTISRQEFVFDALTDIKSIKYHIAGVIENVKIKEHPYWNKVNFTGRFKKEEIPTILNKATISNVLRDFSSDGTPEGSYGILKMFESMEAAIPIICTDVIINREIIAKYNCGICVDINNIQEIREAIKYLIDNKEIAYQMGQNGRRAVIEEYNWNSQFIKYRQIIDSL